MLFIVYRIILNLYNILLYLDWYKKNFLLFKKLYNYNNYNVIILCYLVLDIYLIRVKNKIEIIFFYGKLNSIFKIFKLLVENIKFNLIYCILCEF